MNREPDATNGTFLSSGGRKVPFVARRWLCTLALALLVGAVAVFGPAEAVWAAAVAAAAGLLLVWRRPRRPRSATDPDGDMWKALSEGHDPTNDG